VKPYQTRPQIEINKGVCAAAGTSLDTYTLVGATAGTSLDTHTHTHIHTYILVCAAVGTSLDVRPNKYISKIHVSPKIIVTWTNMAILRPTSLIPAYQHTVKEK
jgi:hypothetical protein